MGGFDREPVAAECGHDNTGVARTRGRDLASRRTADQLHLSGGLSNLAEQRAEVVRLRAEHDQESRVVTEERVFRSACSYSSVESFGRPYPEPASASHLIADHVTCQFSRR
jgi:hypothetical protein